jgi:hypothetical protein
VAGHFIPVEFITCVSLLVDRLSLKVHLGGNCVNSEKVNAASMEAIAAIA